MNTTQQNQPNIAYRPLVIAFILSAILFLTAIALTLFFDEAGELAIFFLFTPIGFFSSLLPGILAICWARIAFDQKYPTKVLVSFYIFVTLQFIGLTFFSPLAIILLIFHPIALLFK